LVAFPLKFLTRRLAALPVTLILSLVLYSTGPDNSESGLSLLPSSAVSAAESAPFSESFGSGPGEQHTDLVSVVLSSLVIVLMSAKLGGATLELFGQPPVLGELVFGVILGNLSILGFHDLDYLSSNEAISILAEIGVIFLLFEVGLGVEHQGHGGGWGRFFPGRAGWCGDATSAQDIACPWRSSERVSKLVAAGAGEGPREL
jgi:Sodium/hydrogen exchanger family